MGAGEGLLTNSALLSFRRNLLTCTACDLHEIARCPVPWSGDPGVEYAVLGEAPGADEDKEGAPFVGASGFILRRWLKQAGFKPDTFAYLNAVSCYPKGTPSSDHMTACRPWMHGQLEIIRPRVLITVGNIAFKSLRHPLTFPTLQALHGKPLFHPRYRFWVWPTYHPSAVLHGRGKASGKKYEEMIVADLKALSEWDGHALEECYICGGELYRYDDVGWGVGLCDRHSRRQGILFPEDLGA